MTNRISTQAQVAAALLLLAAGPVAAQELPQQFGSYMPLYPGLYFTGGYSHDSGDASYDQQGNRRSNAAPQTSGAPTRLPADALTAQFTWHFPLFESYGLPFVSTRTYLARATLRYARTTVRGGLADYIDANPANGLDKGGSGPGDLSLEFGSFLYGSSDWRTRTHHPFAVLALIGVDLPYGNYDHNAPVNAGSNTISFQGKLGVHWQPWAGSFIEAGGGYRQYQINEQPEFGQLAPRLQGADRFWDVSLTQRIWNGLYAGVFYTQRKGSPNRYENPQFAPNAPPPPAGSDDFPTPGAYRDNGTGLTAVGASVDYFLGQRWLASIGLSRPLRGRSGQFALPFTNRTPANCVPGAATCRESPGGTVLVDGMGPARSLASDIVSLTLSYNFGLGDAFSCTNCKK